MRWEIWICSPFTGDPKLLVDSFSNRGHAVSRLRGLIRKAWQSETVYSLRRG
jgi:hypothetical protein